MSQVYYHHQRREAEGKKPFTVAFRRDGDTVSFGFAYCSPRDNFSKKRGRLISEGRLQKNPITVPTSEIGTDVNSIKNLIAYAIENHTNLTDID